LHVPYNKPVILRSHLKQLCEENRRRNIPEITGWLQVLEGNKEWILGQDQNEGKLPSGGIHSGLDAPVGVLS
jgi:hypothetical protein